MFYRFINYDGQFSRWPNNKEFDPRLSLCVDTCERLFGTASFDLEISETPIEDGIKCEQTPIPGVLKVQNELYDMVSANHWLLKQMPSTFWVKAHEMRDDHDLHTL